MFSATKIQYCALATYVPCLALQRGSQFGDLELSLSNAQPINMTLGILRGRGEAQETTGRSCGEKETNSSCWGRPEGEWTYCHGMLNHGADPGPILNSRVALVIRSTCFSFVSVSKDGTLRDAGPLVHAQITSLVHAWITLLVHAACVSWTCAQGTGYHSHLTTFFPSGSSFKGVYFQDGGGWRVHLSSFVPTVPVAGMLNRRNAEKLWGFKEIKLIR